MTYPESAPSRDSASWDHSPEPQARENIVTIHEQQTPEERQEAGLIGCVLNTPSVFDKIRFLLPANFRNANHKTIWSAVILAAQNPEPFTIASIRALCDSIPETVFTYLTNNAANSDAAEEIGRKMFNERGKALALRALKRAQQRIAESPAIPSADEEPWQGVLHACTTFLTEHTKTAESISESQAEAQFLRNLTNDEQPVQTGIEPLDNWLSGDLTPPRIMLITGDAKTGKTVTAATISENLDTAGVPHYYFSSRTSEQQIIEMKMMRRAGLVPTEAKKMNKQELLRHLKPHFRKSSCCYVSSVPRISVNQFMQDLHYHKSKHNIQVAIIDVLSGISGHEVRAHPQAQATYVCTKLAENLQKLNIVTIIFADSHMETISDYYGTIIRYPDAHLALSRDMSDPAMRAYLEMKSTSIGKHYSIGDITRPSLRIDPHGPFMTKNTD